MAEPAKKEATLPEPFIDPKMEHKPPKVKEKDPVLRRVKQIMKQRKTVKLAKGGMVKKKCDGIAKRGKTKGKMR
jgi:hypothetical protein